jgi:hypothetical protein
LHSNALSRPVRPESLIILLRKIQDSHQPKLSQWSAFHSAWIGSAVTKSPEPYLNKWKGDVSTGCAVHTSDHYYYYYYYYSNLRTAAFKAHCAIWVRRSNFRHQASPCMSPRESTQRRKVELWARNVREFCLICRIPCYI